METIRDLSEEQLRELWINSVDRSHENFSSLQRIQGVAPHQHEGIMRDLAAERELRSFLWELITDKQRERLGLTPKKD